MRFSYDPEVDILMVYLIEDRFVDGVNTFSHGEGGWEEGYVADKNKSGGVIDFEIFNASKHYPLEELMKYEVDYTHPRYDKMREIYPGFGLPGFRLESTDD